MGDLVVKQAIKPKGGDLRELVLPGGGDLCLRIWSGIRRNVASLTNWFTRGATNTPAFHHHVGLLEKLLEGSDQHNAHAWSMLGDKPKLRLHCEILFFLEMIQPPLGYPGERTKPNICKTFCKPFFLPMFVCMLMVFRGYRFDHFGVLG